MSQKVTNAVYYLIGTVVRVAKNNECIQATYVPYLVRVAENNKLSLLTLRIWLVGSFMSRTITN